MTREPWGSIAGMLLIAGLGFAIGLSFDDAGRPRQTCPAVSVAPGTTTTGTLPPEPRP